MILHDYFRSSAGFRIRIVLNLKGIRYERLTHHLVRGEQHAAHYLALNPQGLIPALEVHGAALTQSLAILEYLDETHPEPPLLPADPIGRARVRSLAQIIACDTHPIANLRVLKYLKRELGHSQDEAEVWFNHWVWQGLAAIEARLDEPATGRFCHGDTPTIADCCLVPQVVNGARYGLDLMPLPKVRAIADAALALPAFADALPGNQSDAE